MPSRTIYLPDDVSLAEIRLKVKTADLAYPKDHLRDTRCEASDELR
jgi:hypothetical protein